MNKVQLIGRLARDPEIKMSQGENSTTIARFTLAVDRRFSRDQQAADFISMVAFGKTAEFCEKYTSKGMKLAISGRIQTGSFTNKEGTKVYTTDVVAEEIEFCESKRSSDGVAPAQQEPAPVANPQAEVSNDGFGNVDDFESLPFA